MQFKVRHKLTFDSPDFLSFEVPRSNQKTKIMLRSFRSAGPKDTNFFDSSSTTCKDQKEIKNLVESKIQQLHGRMKSFFTHQRKTHLEHVAPEMEEIANSIIQLQEELNRPKSMAEIEEEKHQLLKRKVALLKEIEQTNKKLKENKVSFYQLKFQTQQIDRQLKNGHATIAKYKRKLEADQNKLKHRNNSELTNQQPSQNDVNLDKILNQSICGQNTSSLSPKQSVYQMNEQITQRQMDHVHITEVMGDVNKKLSKQNKQIQNKTVQSHGQNTSIVNQSPVIKDGIKQKQQLKKSQSVASGMMKKKAYFLNSDAHHKENVKLYIKPTFSNNSFEEYMNSSSIMQDQIQKPNKNHKYTKSVIKNTLDMNSELRKYAQLAKRQKWKKINSIFAELQKPPAKHCLLPKSDQSETAKSKQHQVHISGLEELLMEELRKEQFQSFKEKGYHEGLKDKTHQRKIEIKRIFKNYSPDEFFESIINKKPIQKQLAIILEDAFV